MKKKFNQYFVFLVSCSSVQNMEQGRKSTAFYLMQIKGSNASGQWGHCPRQAAVASVPTRHPC